MVLEVSICMSISGTRDITICIVFQININSMFCSHKKMRFGSQIGTGATHQAGNDVESMEVHRVSFILQVRVHIGVKVVGIYRSVDQTDFRSAKIGIYNDKCYYDRVIEAYLLYKNG